MNRQRLIDNVWEGKHQDSIVQGAGVGHRTSRTVEWLEHIGEKQRMNDVASVLPEPTREEIEQARHVRDTTEKKAQFAFLFYRALAYITGLWLLLLVVEMVLKYLVDVNGNQDPVIGTWVAIVHGMIYVVYVLAVFNLWSVMRWGFGRMLYLIIAGVVPVLSFVLERQASHWFREDLPGVLDATEGRALRRAQISRLKTERER